MINFITTQPIATAMFTLSILLLINMILNNRMASKANNLAILQIQLSSRIDHSIIDILDQFIQDIFNEYIILNTEYIKDLYMSGEDEISMVNGIVDMVSNRISPTMYKQLSIYYSERSIPDIISGKIYELVLAYTIEKNQLKEKPPED